MHRFVCTVLIRIHTTPPCLQKGESWLEGECVQQCHCLGDNDVHCTTMRCPASKVCKIKDGVKGCFPFSPATCSVYGDPHYITFDGTAFDFQGECSYTLTTTCGAESSIQFTVTGHNTPYPFENFTRSKLEAVTLEVEDLHLTLNQSTEVCVSIKTPCNFLHINVYKCNSLCDKGIQNVLPAGYILVYTV